MAGTEIASGLKLKVPPVALLVLTAGLMWIVSLAVPACAFEIPGRKILGGVVALAGTVTAVLGIVSFRRAGTTVNPMKPAATSSLVCRGIYSRSRNPMYLGFLLVLTGWAVVLGNALAFLHLPLFVLYMNRFQIEPEERALVLLFGGQFEAYKSRVRRWL